MHTLCVCIYPHTHRYTKHVYIIDVYVCIYVDVWKYMISGSKRVFTNSAAPHHVAPPWFSIGNLWELRKQCISGILFWLKVLLVGKFLKVKGEYTAEFVDRKKTSVTEFWSILWRTCLRCSWLTHYLPSWRAELIWALVIKSILAFLAWWVPTVALEIREEREWTLGFINSPKSKCNIWDIPILKNYSLFV